MRKFYLFSIKDDFFNAYYEKSKSLYNTLKNIYNLKIPYLNYGISLYDQICKPFNVEVLSNYISNRYHTNYKRRFLLKNSYLNEIILIDIKYSCIILVTTNNFSPIFKIFNLYNKKIFVCDFENNDYFWLKDVYMQKKEHIISYNT